MNCVAHSKSDKGTHLSLEKTMAAAAATRSIAREDCRQRQAFQTKDRGKEGHREDLEPPLTSLVRAEAKGALVQRRRKEREKRGEKRDTKMVERQWLR